MPTTRFTTLIAGLAMTAGVVDVDAATLFDEDEVLDVQLSGPINAMIDDSPEKEERPFLLRANGIEHQIRVRLRGNSRLRVCPFPMLRLNFPADTPAGSEFEGQDKLKLVTHCRDSSRSELDVLEEYLAYRIFNNLSDASYRVRRVRVSYIDTDDPPEANTRYHNGFIIESTDGLVHRTGGSRAELPGISRTAPYAEQAALMYIFQYLIGNTDWSNVTADGETSCCHNVDLLTIGSEIYLVPYDFDLSGIVNARYAKPDPSLRISSVRRRAYRGYCVDPEALQSSLRRIVELETEILSLPAATPGMSQRDAERAAAYLESFFDRARDEQRLLERFEARCL